MVADPTEACFANAQRYCMQYLKKATWLEYHYGRMFRMYDQSLNKIQVRENPLIEVKSIKIDGVTVDPSEYKVDYDKLVVHLESMDFYLCDELILEYDAGWEPLPPDLQFAMEQAIAAMSAGVGAGLVQIPGVDKIDIPDVGQINFSTQGYGETVGVSSLLPALKPYEGILSVYRDTSRWRGNPTLRKIEKKVTP